LERGIKLAREGFPTLGPPLAQQIAFIRIDFTNHGVQQVFRVQPNGHDLTDVSNNTMLFDDTPAWSPDRSRIVFARAPNSTLPSALWTMYADGSGQRQLTFPPAGTWDIEPRWSHDGKTIVFQRFYEIWLVDTDGTNPRVLPASQVKNPPALHHMPSWHPNGTEIAFCRESGGLSGIAVAQVNGAPGQFEMLTGNPVLVAFSRNDGNTVRIWTIDASGDVNSEKAVSNPNVSSIDQAPCWSPDGTQLAFTRWGGYPYNGAVWIMNADGSNESNLSALIQPPHTEPPQHVGDMFPNWM
jgi:Tol biopolymer transport system component